MSRDGFAANAEPQGWNGFWEMARRARHRLLALDYDGTLAPFHADRMKALPLDGVAEMLTEIAALPSTSVAVVSGRLLVELLQLLGDLPGIAYVGSHGWQVRAADHEWRSFTTSPLRRAGLDEAATLLDRLDLRDYLERKVGSVAFHVRPFSVPQAVHAVDAVHALWKRFQHSHGLECRVFNGGVELRSPERNKGTALLELCAALPLGALPVYVGDDETDEDAFRAIAAFGLGVKVGELGEATAARASLRDCGEVRDFLDAWLQQYRREGGRP